MKLTRCLPDHVIKMMDPKDRKALGVKTMDEINLAHVVKLERDLHVLVENILRQRSIEFIHSRMDRKTTQKKGVPDFIFAVMLSMAVKNPPYIEHHTSPIACAWELKLPGRMLDPDQVSMLERLTKPPNAWCCRVIHSVDEALAELKRLGL